MNPRSQKGLSLIEVLVASTVMLVVMGGMYMLIDATQKTHLVEGRKLDVNQAGRALEHMFYDHLRSAGAVLSIFNNPVFLGQPPAFNGVFPLNYRDVGQTDGVSQPDGVILAAGDPEGVTFLTAPFTPSSGGSLPVQRVHLPQDSSSPAWKHQDVGILLSPQGYYVFRIDSGGAVIPANGTSLPTRRGPVYFSGLLKSNNYDDIMDESAFFGVKGDAITYPVDTPVVRLSYFAIYLVRERLAINGDIERTLTVTFDCSDGSGNPKADVLNQEGMAMPVVDNIVSFQMEYLSYDENNTTATTPTLYFSSSSAANNALACTSTNAAGYRAIYNQMTQKLIQSTRVYLLLRTDEYAHVKKDDGQTYTVPAMGDGIANVQLTKQRCNFVPLRFEAFLRNMDTPF